MQSEVDSIEFWPVAEAYITGPAAWPLWKDPGWSNVRLDHSTPFDQVGNVVLKLLGDQPAANLSVAAAVDRIISSANPTLSGGIEVTSPLGCAVQPGCCSGIEDRHGWYAFLETEESPWMGHDPSPWLERCAGGVRIWSDREGDACSIELPLEHFVRGLDSVERRLLGFGRRLAEWSPGEGERLAEWFLRAFKVRSP